MTPIETLIDEFAAAWTAGRRPDAGEYLERAADADRDELARRLSDYLAQAPVPDYDEPTLVHLRQDPALVAAFEFNDAAAQPLGGRLRALREQAGLGVRDLARRVGSLFEVSDEERTARYLEQVERQELDETRLSERLLDGLAAILRTDPRRLTPMRPAPAVAQAFFRAESEGRAQAEQDLDVLSRLAASPAPEPMDELDRLFRGGPHG